MQSADDFDGIDFKPFFDMVIGVLFVLLILIGALLYREQTTRADAAGSAAAQRHREWQQQKAAFLGEVADHLRRRGLSAQVDLANATIILPLAEAARIRGDGLPAVQPQAAAALGDVLAVDVGCVAADGAKGPDCSLRRELQLDALTFLVRVDGLAAAAALPPDRFGNLLMGRLAADMSEHAPALLRLSNHAGAMLLHTGNAVGGAAPASDHAIAGDLAIGFDFAPR